MAAIFYDAVEATMPVVELDRGYGSKDPNDPTTFAILIKGSNLGYAVGDKIQYQDSTGKVLFTANVKNIYSTESGYSEPGYPNGYTRLFVSPPNAATILPIGKQIDGGSVSPVTTASVIPPSQSGGVVSAATILKNGVATAPGQAVAQVRSATIFGLQPKKAIFWGIGIAVAIWLGRKFLKKGK